MASSHSLPDDSSAVDAGHLNAAVRRLAIAHRGRTAALLGRCGVSIGQELLLLQLADHEPCTQAELAAASQCEASTITIAVRKLEAAGLVRRAQSAHDARAVAVHLTARGRALVPSLREAQATVAADVLSGLSHHLTATELITILEGVTEQLVSQPTE